MTTVSLSPEEFITFRTFLAEICGILVGDNKAYLIETRLRALVIESACTSFTELHQKLKYGGDVKLRDKVIDLMTTNETLWFRDSHPFKILKDVLLPEYAEEALKKGRRSLRIWSAASSTGQEPYSIAMTILEAQRMNPELKKIRFEIIASDISTTALRMAKLGRYESLAISRGLPQEYRNRYFKQDGRVWSIAPEVKQMVTLKKFNLQDSLAPFGRFDIILCRNVAIYFSDEFKRGLFDRISKALNPEGIFFLGASESLAKYCSAFDMKTASAGIYYKLRKN
jgi:chemotaxis protein methyltransferase CheR